MRLWFATLVSLVLLQLVSGGRRHALNTSSSFIGQPPRVSCEELHQLCLYREGCGTALQNYIHYCSGYLNSKSRLEYCPKGCHDTLVALTSTQQGKHMLNCKCSNDHCERQLQRAQVCRPMVEEAIRKESIVSCSLAAMICNADTLCARALGYYNENCKSIEAGIKCSDRCNNSLSILMRQEKAAKLSNCVCDGTEPYDCVAVRNNLASLCLHQLPVATLPPPNVDTNEVFSAAAAPATPCWTIAAVVLGRLLQSLVARQS